MFKVTFEELTDTIDLTMTAYCENEQDLIERLKEEYYDHLSSMKKEEGYKVIFYANHHWCRFRMPYERTNCFKVKTIEWRLDDKNSYITLFRENVWIDEFIKKLFKKLEKELGE